MIARLWRTGVDGERIDRYARFERERSLPMFRRQRVCLEALFLRDGHGCAALSVWEDEAAIDGPAVRGRRAAVEGGSDGERDQAVR